MDKQQEIELLEEFINNYPSDSYCGERFKDQLPFMKTAIQSDVMAGVRCLSFRKSMIRSKRIVEQANKISEEIIQEAKDTASKKRAEAYKDSAAIRERAISDIRKILKELES